MENRIYYYLDPEIDDELSGLADNVHRAASYYPGWKIRAIIPEDAGGPRLDEIEHMGIEITRHPKKHPIQVPDLIGLAHAAVTQPNHRFLIRSVYCRLGARERAAVAQWERSAAQFHVIRDDAQEHDTQIVPHLWGSFQSRVGQLPSKMVRWLDDFFKGNSKDFLDPSTLAEVLLREVVWPRAKHWGCMRHDPYPRTFDSAPLPFPDYSPDDQPTVGLVYLGCGKQEKPNATEERQEPSGDLGEHSGAPEIGSPEEPSHRDSDEQGGQETQKEVVDTPPKVWNGLPIPERASSPR